MKVIALNPHTFAGRQRKPGDEYEINKQSDVELMVRIGHVKLSDPPAPVTSHTAATVGKPGSSRKRAYNRRDLVSQQ